MAVGPGTRSLVLRPKTFTVRTAQLKVTKGRDAGRKATISEPLFVVGVGETADLRLSDTAVSREHVRISLGPDGVRVRDLGSKNGTYLGSVRIDDITIVDDVTLTIGETTLAIKVAKDAVDLPLSGRERFGDAIGTSLVMRHLFAQLEKVADSDLTVLLEGESGVGKDVLARAIHERSARASAPFVIADCGAIAPHLVESELFGHEKGAFTGADRARRGVFEEAHGGTLFLDEVGELPLDLQPKLLRVLEQREVRPVGSNTARPVDVRVIAATNRRLAEAARIGEFRSDLFYRLAVVRGAVPPLRARVEDIVPIAREMLQKLKNDPSAEIPDDFASMLTSYAWPGNVRELRNVIERYAVFGLDPKSLFDDEREVAEVKAGGDEELTYHEARQRMLDRFDQQYLPRVLARADGVIARAAELAGVARPTFYRMLQRHRKSKNDGAD